MVSFEFFDGEKRVSSHPVSRKKKPILEEAKFSNKKKKKKSEVGIGQYENAIF